MILIQLAYHCSKKTKRNTCSVFTTIPKIQFTYLMAILRSVTMATFILLCMCIGMIRSRKDISYRCCLFYQNYVFLVA